MAIDAFVVADVLVVLVAIVVGATAAADSCVVVYHFYVFTCALPI